jgi:uncharacterized protein DUF6265
VRMKNSSAPLRILGVLLLMAATSVHTPAQQPAGAGVPSPAPQVQINAQAAPVAPVAKPSLADFAWLVGRWEGAWGPRIAQQVWTPPKAGVMLGTFQLAEGDKTLVLELFTLVEGPEGIKLYIRHFTPTLAAWEKSSPTTLTLTSLDPKSASFENQVDGQPKHAVLTHPDPDIFISRSEIVPDKSDTQVTEITYHRMFDGPPPKQRKNARQ